MRRAKRKKRATTVSQLVASSKRAKVSKYVLRLYISGSTPQSQRAIINLKHICDEYLEGRVDIEVIDVYQAPARAKKDNIIAVPALVKLRPLPYKQLLGDFSDQSRVLEGLGISVKEARRS